VRLSPRTTRRIASFRERWPIHHHEIVTNTHMIPLEEVAKHVLDT
jgi:hypothetical protein